MFAEEFFPPLHRQLGGSPEEFQVGQFVIQGQGFGKLAGAFVQSSQFQTGLGSGRMVSVVLDDLIVRLLGFLNLVLSIQTSR